MGMNDAIYKRFLDGQEHVIRAGIDVPAKSLNVINNGLYHAASRHSWHLDIVLNHDDKTIKVKCFRGVRVHRILRSDYVPPKPKLPRRTLWDRYFASRPGSDEALELARELRQTECNTLTSQPSKLSAVSSRKIVSHTHG